MNEKEIDIIQYLLRKIKVKQDDVFKLFNVSIKDIKDLNDKIKNVGLVIRPKFDYMNVEYFVIGLRNIIPIEINNEELKKISLLLLIAYYIVQEPEKRILWEELKSGFKNYTPALNEMINTLKWLDSDSNYIYISPIGKFILHNYLRKNKETNQPYLIDEIEDLLD